MAGKPESKSSLSFLLHSCLPKWGFWPLLEKERRRGKVGIKGLLNWAPGEMGSSSPGLAVVWNWFSPILYYFKFLKVLRPFPALNLSKNILFRQEFLENAAALTQLLLIWGLFELPLSRSKVPPILALSTPWNTPWNSRSVGQSGSSSNLLWFAAKASASPALFL